MPQHDLPEGAEAALTGPREPYEQMLAAYRRRRAVALDTAASVGVRAVASDGTLYMLLDVSASGVDDLDFALGLLRSHSVSVAPGSVFGPAGRGWARISLAAESEAIAEGLRRLAKVLHEHDSERIGIGS